MEILFGLLIAFLAGLAQSCAGFGLGMIFTPSLMLLFPPTQAVPTVILLSIVNSSLVTFNMRKHLRWDWLLPLLIGGFLGMPIGIRALLYSPQAYLKTAVGALVFLFALALFTGWRRPVKNMRRALAPVGLACGFFGGATAMGGPPIVLFLSNQNTNKQTFRATTLCYFTVMGFYGVLNFTLSGMIDSTILLRALTFLPGMLTGTLLGIRLAHKIPESTFRKLVILGAGGMGIMLLSAGIRGIIAS